MTYAPKTQVITSEYVQAPRGGCVVRIPLENITHFTFGDKYASAHTDSGELILAISLHEIEEIIGDLLVRTHRSCLAVRKRLVSLTRDAAIGGAWAIVRSAKNAAVQHKIRVSRRQVPIVRNAMHSGAAA